jgi:DNA-binding GntR family transcriptional regulator
MFDKSENEIEGTRRSELVYERLTEALVALEIPPGTALSENKLAKEMGVSRTPIRAALLQLELEGLVEQPAGGSYIVRGLTQRDVEEICDLLEVLDCYVAKKAMQHCSTEQFDALLAHADEMKQAAAARDIARWSIADKAFHELIQSGAGNQLVTSLVVKTRRRIHRFWASSVRPERLQECSTEHEQIALAMRDGDADRALSMIRDHIAHMRISLIDLLTRAAAFLPRQTSAARPNRKNR